MIANKTYSLPKTYNPGLEGHVINAANTMFNAAKNEGLNIGTLKSKIDTKEIINKMRLNRNDLAWIGIELKGTNAIVKVVEADKKRFIFVNDIVKHYMHYENNNLISFNIDSTNSSTLTVPT